MAHIGGYALKAVLGEQQAVINRIAAVHAGQVLGIGFKQGCRVALNGIGQCEQQVIYLILLQNGKRV